jgi:hypothetical protein
MNTRKTSHPERIHKTSHPERSEAQSKDLLLLRPATGAAMNEQNCHLERHHKSRHPERSSRERTQSKDLLLSSLAQPSSHPERGHKTSHPERSGAQSKDLLLLLPFPNKRVISANAQVLKGHGFSRAVIGPIRKGL